MNIANLGLASSDRHHHHGLSEACDFADWEPTYQKTARRDAIHYQSLHFQIQNILTNQNRKQALFLWGASSPPTQEASPCTTSSWRHWRWEHRGWEGTRHCIQCKGLTQLTYFVLLASFKHDATTLILDQKLLKATVPFVFRSLGPQLGYIWYWRWSVGRWRWLARRESATPLPAERTRTRRRGCWGPRRSPPLAVTMFYINIIEYNWTILNTYAILYINAEASIRCIILCSLSACVVQIRQKGLVNNS